jgi:hypothetical protein
MLSVSASGWHFSRPSRCLTIRLQGLGLARVPQHAFFDFPDNVAPSVLRLVAEAGQPGLWFSQAPAFMRGIVDFNNGDRRIQQNGIYTEFFGMYALMKLPIPEGGVLRETCSDPALFQEFSSHHARLSSRLTAPVSQCCPPAVAPGEPLPMTLSCATFSGRVSGLPVGRSVSSTLLLPCCQGRRYFGCAYSFCAATSAWVSCRPSG